MSLELVLTQACAYSTTARDHLVKPQRGESIDMNENLDIFMEKMDKINESSMLEH